MPDFVLLPDVAPVTPVVTEGVFSPFSLSPPATTSYRGIGTIQTTASTSHTVPAPAGQAAGDINFLVTVVKPYTATVTVPDGWVLLAEAVSGSVASGAGVGSVKVAVFQAEGATGSVTLVTSAATARQSFMVSYTKNDPTDTVLLATTTGIDGAVGVNYSAPASVQLSERIYDLVIEFTGNSANLTDHSGDTLSVPGLASPGTFIRTFSNSATGDACTLSHGDKFTTDGVQSGVNNMSFTTTVSNEGATVFVRLSGYAEENPTATELEQLGTTTDVAEGFPNVVVEWAPESDFSEKSHAPTGFTDITQFVASVSGSLRSREYEIATPEAGSLTVVLDNDDGRFTPGSRRSPYAPNVKANRRFRIRGKNMVPPNIALGGGKEHSTLGFRAGTGPYASPTQNTPTLVTHDPFLLPAGIGNYHIEQSLQNLTVSGLHDILEWYVPIELGQRLTHSAYIWKVSGMEAYGTSGQMVITYYDENDEAIVPTNLALNRPATSPQADFNVDTAPAKAVTGTWWQQGFNDKWCSIVGAPYSLKVDLGSVQDISGFGIWHAGAFGEDETTNTKDFTISVSNDDSTYTVVSTTVGNLDTVTFHNTPCSGRYMKLDITNAGRNNQVRIYEFQVYGIDGNVDQRSSSVTWANTPTVPTRFAFSDQAPLNARYAVMRLRINVNTHGGAGVTGGIKTGPVTYAVTGIQTEVPTNNYAPLTDRDNFHVQRLTDPDFTTMNQDTSFESGSVLGSYVATNGATITRDAAHPKSGQWGLKVVPDGVSSDPGFRSEEMAVVGGRTYYITGWFFSASAATVKLGCTFYDNTHTQIGSSSTTYPATNVANMFKQWPEQSFTAPSNAAYVRVFCRISGVVSTVWWVDDITIKAKTVTEGITVDIGQNGGVGVDILFSQGDVGAYIDIPRLTPGDTYTAVATVYKSGAPDMLLTADDGQSGTVIYDGLWQTTYLTFLCTKVAQRLRFRPQVFTDVIPLNSVLRIRNMTVLPGAVDPSADFVVPSVGWSAQSPEDNGMTSWEEPKPIFEGWTSDLPAEAKDFTSMVSVTVNDRLTRLGNVELSNNLQEMLFRDGVDMLLPLSDSPLDVSGKVSMLGAWGVASGITSAQITRMTSAAIGNAGYTLGIQGPTIDNAIQWSRKTTPSQDGTGYAIPIPYSKSFVPAPVPLVTVRDYSSTYYATWSHSYNGNNVRRFDDASNTNIYQGNCCSGDSSCCGNGDLKGLIGFDQNAIWADIHDAEITSAWFHIYAKHWWWSWGGYPTIGWHTYGEDQGPYTWSYSRANLNSYTTPVYSPRNAWLSFSIWTFASEPLRGWRGMSVGGTVSRDLRYYGYYAGAKEASRPYITYTYRK